MHVVKHKRALAEDLAMRVVSLVPVREANIDLMPKLYMLQS